jgi:protein O-mannosyl-transferase
MPAAKIKPHRSTKTQSLDKCESAPKPILQIRTHESGGNLRASAAWFTQVPALCLLLFVATAAVYAPLVRHDFIDYDDDRYVVTNPHVNTGLHWQNIEWALTTDAVANWHPLTWISHQLDSQLYGLDHPGGHHATSLLLHILNVLILFLLLFRATGAKWPSFVVAALFALHPLNVESVAWLAERKNVLCTFFFLLAIGAYGWYARKPDFRRYALVAGLFVLGLASKPMVITLPFVLLLIDFWPLGRVENWSSPSSAFPVNRVPLLRLVAEKLPLLLLSAGSAMITMIVQRRGNELVPIADSPLSWRLQNAIWAYASYLWKATLPRGLAPFYPTMELPVRQVVLASVALLAISVLVWKKSSGRPYLAVGYLWFLGTLVPVIGIVQVGAQSMADRYTYIPLIGIFVAMVWAAFDAAATKISPSVQTAAVFIILLALAFGTWRQVGFWKDSITIWSHALNVTVDNFVAEEDLAVGLANEGRDDEAFPHFLIARQIRPTDAVANLNIGINLEQHGRHRDAIQEFDALTHITDDPGQLFDAHRRMAKIYAEIGIPEKARAEFLQACQINPNDLSVLTDLGKLETDEAVARLSRSVSAHPTAQGYLQLGQLLEQGGKSRDAQAAYRNALRLDPKLPQAKQALANLSNGAN